MFQMLGGWSGSSGPPPPASCRFAAPERALAGRMAALAMQLPSA